MRVFIFYSAHLEIENDIKERQKLLEQLQNIDKRIEFRNGFLVGLLKGIIENKKGNFSSDVQQNMLIAGGEELKYQGITIHKHKTCNTWYTRFRANGKQFFISARTQQDCYDKLKLALKKQKSLNLKMLKEKEPTKKHSMTFIDWFNKWVSLYKQNVKQGTRNDYNKCLAYLKKIQNKEICQITSMELMEQLNNIPFERTKQKTYELLSAIFQKALVNEVVEKNPMLIIEKPKHKRINGIALSSDDENRFEDVLINKRADMFLVCLYQGLRKGEMLALTIDDVDFKKKTLTINKSINRFNEVDSTKNDYSNRTIPLFEKTERILEKYQGTVGRLFPIAYQSCENKFKKIIAKEFPGVRYTIHSLRHTFITRCQECNIPLHIIQRWVGHTIGSSVTSSVYTHSREVAELENIEVFNKKLNSNWTHLKSLHKKTLPYLVAY